MIHIPKLIQSNYKVNVPFHELPRTLQRWQNDQEGMGYKLELEPDFQRGHVWTQAQKARYIEWVLMGGESGLTLIFNHPGWQSSFQGDMVCVDGLQRITATLEFFAGAVLPFGVPVSEITDHQLRGASMFEIQIGRYNRAKVLEWYLQLNSGGTVHTKDQLDKVRALLDVEKVNEDLFA